MRNTVIILDFGGQYNQLIARRVREQHVYCELLPCDASYERVMSYEPKGIREVRRTYMRRMHCAATEEF